MNKIKIFSILFISAFVFSSCEDEVEAPGTPFVAFESNIGDVTVAPGAPLTKTINVYSANTTGSDRSVNLVVKDNSTIGSSSYTMPSSITIPANASSASFDIVFVEDGLELIQDQVLAVAMESSELYTGEDISLNVAKGCAPGSSKLKIALTIDAYPEEVYWRIRNASTGEYILASQASPGYGGLAGITEGTIQTDAACLPAGDYLFEIFDQYGDGGGACNITIDGVQIFATSGAYGGGAQLPFTI
jgi:hypothetical protein